MGARRARRRARFALRLCALRARPWPTLTFHRLLAGDSGWVQLGRRLLDALHPGSALLAQTADLHVCRELRKGARVATILLLPHRSSAPSLGSLTRAAAPANPPARRSTARYSCRPSPASTCVAGEQPQTPRNSLSLSSLRAMTLMWAGCPLIPSQALPPWGNEQPTDKDISAFVMDPLLQKPYKNETFDHYHLRCAIKAGSAP